MSFSLEEKTALVKSIHHRRTEFVEIRDFSIKNSLLRVRSLS
jgi:hypothetical protein